MLPNQKTVFIVNPRAGNGTASAKWRAMSRLAEEQLGTFTTCFTERAGDATRLTREQVAAGADLIHFDVMDNHYVPNLTIGPLVCAAIRPHVQIPIDVHLMVKPTLLIG